MANADGAIVLTVEIDTGGLGGEMSKLKSAINSSLGGLESFDTKTNQVNNITNVFNQTIIQTINNITQMSSVTQKTVTQLNVYEKATTKAKNATTSLQNAAKKFLSSLGIYLSLRQLVRFSNEASKLAAQTEANVKRLSTLYGEAAQSVYDFANDNAYAFGMAKSAAYDAAADYGNIFTTFADGAQSAKLTNEMLQATAVIASQTGRTYEDVFEKIRSGLYGNTRAIDDLGISVRQSSLMQTNAYAEVSKNGTRSWNSLTDAELQQARALGIIEQAQIKYGNTVMQSTALTRSQFNAAWTDFKATWGQAVNLVLIPILQVATQILNTVTAVMQKIFHLTGKQLDTSSKINSSIGSAVENQEELTDSIKGTNKELKKELASFDKLEILSRNTTNNATSGSGGNGGGVSTSGGDVGGGLGETIINQGEIDAKLAAIAGLAGAALVGLGILVMFSGHFLLGLGMIALGAATVWTAAKMLKNIPEEQKPKLEKIFDIVGKVAFMIGLILLFIPGCFLIGLGLMAAGASSLKISESLKTDVEGQEDLKKKLSELIILAGIIAFMIGLILLFIPGCRLIGLGLMAKGAVAVGGGVLLSGEDLKTALEQTCTDFWEVLYGIGVIMVIVGIVVLFSVNFLIGVGLILLGIAELVGVTQLGGDALKQELKTFCENYWEEIVKLAAIMVVVGIALLFTGSPLIGLGLILLGIATIAKEEELSGDKFNEELKTYCENHIEKIKAIKIITFVLGIILLFTPAFLAGLGLLVVSYTAANIEEKTLSDTELTQGLLGQLTGVKDWLEGLMVAIFVIGVLLLFIPVPGCLQVGISLIGSSAVGLFSKKSLDSKNLKTSLKTQLSDVQATAKQGVANINAEYAKIGQTAPSSVNVSTNGTVKTKAVTQSVVAQSVSYEVPALARGAVIPANREFLAVLGDQKRGTNVEAPAELIKQMAKEAYQEMGLANNQQQQIIKEEHYNLSETELMTIMYKLVKGGERLNGTSLVRQGGI